MKHLSRKWLIVVAVLLAGVFAVGVPVLASTGNNPATAPPIGNGYGAGCADSGALTRLATALGLTPADLTVQLQSGKTLAAIAGEKNVATSVLVDTIVAPFEARIALQVQNGYLTQAQAQTYLDAARQAGGNLLTQNLASVAGNNSWAGFCGNYLNGDNIGFGPMGPGMRGVPGEYNGNLVPPTNPALTPPVTPPVYGWGMIGGGWGCR